MDVPEKQQIIESIKAITKARWFFASTVFIQGIIVKYFFPGVPLARTWQLVGILVISYIYNLSFSLYVHRPAEKITDWGIKIIKNLQLPLDALAVSAILYFSGTIDKLVVVWYFVVIMIGIAIYGKKGIIWSTFICSALYSGLAIMEYYGFLNTPSGAIDFVSIKGNLTVTEGRIIGFNTYMIAAGFFAWFLGDLFRRREKRLVGQRNELSQKTEQLTHQTQELTKTRDYLHEALSKSDKARAEVEKTKEELQKTNLELKAKIVELEKYGEVTTGRELRMVELKEKMKSMEHEIDELKGRLESV